MTIKQADINEHYMIVPKQLIFSRRRKCVDFAQSVKLSSEYTWDQYMMDLYKIMTGQDTNETP